MFGCSIRQIPIFLSLLIIFVLTTTGAILAQPASDKEGQQTSPSTTFRSSSVMFIENVGQWDERARFQIWGGSVGTMWLTKDAIWITIAESLQDDTKRSQVSAMQRDTHDPITPRARGVNVKLSFVAANPHPRLESFDRLDTHASYFMGSNPNTWYSDVSIFGGVRYVDLWPGVDLEITSEQGEVRQRFVAHSDVEPQMVRLKVAGAGAGVQRGQALHLATAVGDIVLPLPLADFPLQMEAVISDDTPSTEAQEVGGGTTMDENFLREDALPDNPAALRYSTFVGGSGDECGIYDGGGCSVATDEVGNTYVTGGTRSADFPTIPGAYDTSFNGASDTFVVKMTPSGTEPAYITFLGGQASDAATTIALDASGNAFVGGSTSSTDFPTTQGAFKRTLRTYDSDGFLAKLSPTGNRLIYSTLLGGNLHGDSIADVVVDESGNAHVTGDTLSSDFPTTPYAFDRTYNEGGADAFVAKLNTTGSGLIYSSYLGGSHRDGDVGASIALDQTGSAYITGWTKSSDFPTTAGAYDRTFASNYCGTHLCADAFVAKFSPSGSSLVYSTFLGGNYYDVGQDIAIDAAGSAYIIGSTDSADFPATPKAFDPTCGSNEPCSYYNSNPDAFITKLLPNGSALVYSSFLGGSGADDGDALVVDGRGRAYVVGSTQSSDFPATSGAFDTSYGGGTCRPESSPYDCHDAFVAVVSVRGTNLDYATFLGADSDDYGSDLVADEEGDVYVVGRTSSSNFPTTTEAFDRTYNGGSDVFAVRLAVGLDTGFRPNPDGYNFPNYGGSSASDYSTDDMRRMFGDAAVCNSIGPVCIVKRAARKWNSEVNRFMNNGHCDGMASTSLRFFKDLDQPVSFQTGADTTHDLQLANIRRHIAYYFVEQVTDPVKAFKEQSLQNTPLAILAQLQSAMSGNVPDPTTLFLRQANQGGHAITPYAIQFRGNDVYWVRVYDNNYPNDTDRYVVINTTANSWSYDMGGRWGTWRGDATSHTLGIVPISEYGKQPVCPWCGSSASQGNSISSTSGQVWLAGKGHLLITDTQGRRIGFVDEQFMNEIPGAYESIVDGGLGIVSEPIYTLPLNEFYTIQVDGQGLAETETVAVTQFGPGFAASIEDVKLSPSSQDQLTVGLDGTQLRYRASNTTVATLALALDWAGESDEFQVRSVDIGSGQLVELRADMSSLQLVFDNAQAGGGRYDLKIELVNDGDQQAFYYADLEIAPTDTHYVNYGAWDSSGPMMLEIDHESNGTIDQTLLLENQMQSVYLPIIFRDR